MSLIERGIVVAVTAVAAAVCAVGFPLQEPLGLEQFAPLPRVESGTSPSDAPLVQLGRMLYFEPRLSRNQTISCNSCHPLTRYGVDGSPTSAGYRGVRGTRNAPTVFNAAAQFVQFWDGRAASVEEQAKGPLLNPSEMAMPSGEAVVQVIESIPEYVEAFRSAFPGELHPVTFDNAARAIGAFERKLITPSHWDEYTDRQCRS